MAAGVPVVAAKATGSSGLVVDGATGRLMPPDDASGFADALEAYCRDLSLARAHGAAAAEAAAPYDWERINLSVAQAYLDLIARRKAGG